MLRDRQQTREPRTTLDGVIGFTVNGRVFRHAIREIGRGSYNVVYEVVGSTLVVVIEYEGEVRLMRRMADLGLGPRVFADLRIGETGIGVVMERLELSLSEAESSPSLARRVFRGPRHRGKVPPRETAPKKEG